MTAEHQHHTGDRLGVLGAQATIETTELLLSSTPTPGPLWHYTDSAGTLGILRSSTLWATHALYMNDASELRYALPMLRAAIDAVEHDHAAERHVEHVMSALRMMLAGDDADPEVYVVCFCENGDLLSQWREYGRGGGGYAIGFDGRALAGDVVTTAGLTLTKVIYDVERQRDLARKVVGHTAAVYLRHVKAHPEDAGGGDATGVIMRSFNHAAQTFSYRVKDPAFAEENEWRLIYNRKPYVPSAQTTRHFRAGARGIVPYVEIPTRPATEMAGPVRLDLGVSRLPVTDVLVGPTTHPEIAEQALRYLLSDLDRSEVQVGRSTIPLRA